jgi:hypothetical protein
MRIILLNKIYLSIFGILSISAFAEDNKSEYFKIEGSHSAIFPLKNKNLEINSFNNEALSGIKTIQLNSITVSDLFKEKNKLAIQYMNINDAEFDYKNGITPFTNSAYSIDLGMGSVPVLDQGAHGTPLTFSSVTALAAKLKQGDLMDLQCSFALTNLFNDRNILNNYNSPGQIIDLFKKYGIVHKNDCFGHIYPDPSQIVTLKKYLTRSDKNYSSQMTYHYSEKANADLVKATLKAGYRVVISTALADNSDPISVNGFNVKIKGTTKNYDGGLWACKQPGNSSNYCVDQNAGHEVVVIGFDDKQQLFKIRNSWGIDVGEKGNYYMTYSFFNAMAMNQTEFR